MLIRLCTHPKWIEILRKEIGSRDSDHATLERLPLLDSLMKEVLRTTPLTLVRLLRLSVNQTLTVLHSEHSEESSQAVYLFGRWPSRSSRKDSLRFVAQASPR